MAAIPTNTTVTLFRRADDTTDSYGNPTGDFEEVASYDAWVERTRYNEPQHDGETDATDWLMLLPGAVTLQDKDRFLYRDEFYEIAADPYKQTPPGGAIHHTECRLRPAVVPTLRDKAIATTLVDECTITRRGVDTFNDDTGQIVPGAVTTVFTGPCLIRPRDAYNRETTVADDAVTLMSLQAFVPYDVDTVEDDDVLTATRTDDGRLLNRPLRVSGVSVGTENATRVLFLEDDLG